MSKIITQILKQNKITLDRYIETCLYHKKFGYYQKKKIFGKDGDFITSPYISSIFGEIIAIYILNFFLEKNVNTFNILELGAGEGVLSKDIIQTLNKFSNYKIKFNYYIYEKSSNLIKRQKQNNKSLNICWIKDIKKFLKKNTIILTNELLDSLAVTHLVKKKNLWLEKNIKLKKDKKLSFEFTKTKKNIKKILNYLPKNTNFIEYPVDLLSLLNQISKILKIDKHNLFIGFDYGYYSNKFYDTVQCLKQHKKIDLFSDPGNSDITHLVNFYLVEQILKKKGIPNITLTTQSNFLKKNGVIERLKQSLKHSSSFEHKEKVILSVKRLVNHDQMGDRFKVIQASVGSI